MRELYFAYGSNMSSRRLFERVPGTCLGPARLPGMRLVCNKRGRDGSGKANLIADAGSITWGILYEIAVSDWPVLDRTERGYERQPREVIGREETAVSAQIYLWTADTPAIPPYHWYRRLLIEGALEHRLPADYLRQLEDLPWTVDPIPESRGEGRAIEPGEILLNAGYRDA